MTETTRHPDHVLDVLIVGAGFAGICAAIKLREQGLHNIRIYEKAAGIGGTWWHNTYPGAACDIASHLYCYSFEPNPYWSRIYSPQKEIQAYIEHCADKYDVGKNIQLNTAVREFTFDEEHKLWIAHLDDGSNSSARHVIFASGALHLPAFPDIPGSEQFAGPSMHSAQWDHEVDFTDKRVAVIGSAASAIQLIPELAEVASQLDVYQRTPNYIAPRNDREFTAREKARFARWPWISRLYRAYLFLRGELLLFPIVKTRHYSLRRERLEHMVKKHIRTSVARPGEREAMVPDYPLGCKRILIADNFFSAMNRSNVQLITSAITSIETDALVTADGERRGADIIVYATGFDLENYMRSTEVTGPGGIRLSELWSRAPAAYRGAFVPGLPNFYLTTGPNTGVGTTSVVYMIEAQLQLILQSIKLAGADKQIQVSQAAHDRYNHEIRGALKETVWAGSCNSWYKNEEGEISTLYPHNARRFRREHRMLRMEDFELSETARDILTEPAQGG
jgi:cation diffusion facilitator CzcD-associated flavoprotein CzcO